MCLKEELGLGFDSSSPAKWNKSSQSIEGLFSFSDPTEYFPVGNRRKKKVEGGKLSLASATPARQGFPCGQWTVDLEVRRTCNSLGSDFPGSLAGVPVLLPTPSLKIELLRGG